jgi:hypothetical protein
MILRVRAALCALLVAVVTVGCGATDEPAPGELSLREARAMSRPIGAAPRYTPPARERPVAECRPALGPRIAAHLELFGHDRVVVVPAGIGIRGAHVGGSGRVEGARCYGPVVTLDPTGIVLVRPGTVRTVGGLFRAWGAPLGPARMAGFGGRVRAYVGGRPVAGEVGVVALARHAVVVLEVGPFVPPHRDYSFP